MKETIQMIKNDLKTTKLEQKQIAAKYGISVAYISKINRGASAHDPNERYPLRGAGYRDPLPGYEPGIFGLYFEETSKWFILASKSPKKRFFEIMSSAFNPSSGDYPSKSCTMVREAKPNSIKFVLLENCGQEYFNEKIKHWIEEKGGLLNVYNTNYQYSDNAVAVLKIDVKSGKIVKIYNTIKDACDYEGVTSYALNNSYEKDGFKLVRKDEVK